MKIVILKSIKNLYPEDEYTITMDTKYADRLIGHLTNRPDFAETYEDECHNCRTGYKLDYLKNIVKIFEFPATLPFMLEEPEEYLPESVPEHDVLVAISVNEEILISFIKNFPVFKGVIVPIEDASWITPYGIKSITEICNEKGIEVAFPKPFCSFDPQEGVLLKFREYFKIGKPEIKFTVENETIKEAKVLCSAPCGATYYTACHLYGKKLEDNLEYIIDSSLFHYPCISGSNIDKDFNDSVMHHAVKLQRALLKPLKSLRSTQN